MITTEAFLGLARTEGAAFGMPDVRLVAIPHPLSGARPEEIARYARTAVAAIVALMSG